jgi:hypothetical protein
LTSRSLLNAGAKRPYKREACRYHLLVLENNYPEILKHHEMKEVHKASKRAKTFEMQKVVKKLKDLGYEPDSTLLTIAPIVCLSVSNRKKGHNTQTVEEYEAELTCLKVVLIFFYFAAHFLI